MKGFGWRRDRQQSAAYCRRDNRVYRSCPLGGNWETCTLNCDCLLAGDAAAASAPATPGSSAGRAPALAWIASPTHGRASGKAS